MKKLLFSACVVLGLIPFTASAQLTGIKNIPGDYATLDLAILDLNTQGVGPGGVIFNQLAGNPETAPIGGYVITAEGTAANAITFMGNSNVLTASPTLVAGALNDGIVKIVGGDFITFMGYSLVENPANTVTAAATNNMTEWGVALLYSSVTNGAQNNTIASNTISLDRNYLNSMGVYSNVRHSSTDVGTLADITNNTTAPNSNNKVWGNIISNVNAGVIFIGSATAANMDMTNDIGGTSALTANTISNYGNAGVVSSFQGVPTTIVIGVYVNNQIAFNISFNSIISASLNTSTALRGILTDYSALPSGTFSNNILSNTVTFTQAGSGSLQPITTASAAGAIAGVTFNLNDNNIINNAVTGVASAVTIFGVANLAPCGTLNMTGNIFRNNTSTATTAGCLAITNQGAVITAVNITNNQIGNSTGGAATFSATTSGAMSGIANTSATATTTVTITGNNLQGFSGVGGPFVGISNSSTAAGTVIISNNTLGNGSANLVTYSGTSTGTVTGIQAGGVNVTVNANDFRGIVHSVTASATVNMIVTTGAPLSLTVSNNTYTNLNLATTGTATLISHSYTIPAGGSQTISGNSIVTGLTKSGGGGNIVCTSTGASSPSGTTASYLNNNFSNITHAGTGNITGINSTDGTSGTSTKIITGNTFNNWSVTTGAIVGMNISYWTGSTSVVTSNTLTNFAGQAAISGIVMNNSLGNATAITIGSNTINTFTSSGTGGNVVGISSSNGSTGISYTGNTIHTLSSTGASTVTGILVSGGTSSVTRNKIYGLAGSNAASLVNGITISGGATQSVVNNTIGELTAPIASANNVINGINVSGGTTVNVYYNTVHLNATSTGTNFGTTGINAATGSTLDLRNNLVVNLSTPAGTGLIAAYRRSSTTLTSYASTSNNNSFYAGTPSATNVIYTDGTNTDQTMGAFQSRVAPRDAASLSENPTFMSLTGSSPSFLHIAAATATLLESGGGVIATFTTDYDNDARPGPAGSVNGGAIAPDIGADEFDGILVTCTGTPTAGTPSVSAAVCGSGTFVLSATGASTGPGITYQWQSSLTAGGPYTNIAGGTTLSYTTATTSTTTYFVLVVNCTTSSQSVVTTEVTGTVHPAASVSVTPTSGTFCSPTGSPIALTASGASTYAWLPASGLSSATGANVNATPGSTTTYTVTGTDVNGCTATATTTITVSEIPVVSSVTATPSSVCSGGSSQLNATAGITTNYTVASATFATEACQATAGPSGDDVVSGALGIGFSFNYFGVTYSQFGISTNGNIQLGNGTGTANNPAYSNQWTDAVNPTAAVPNNLIALAWDDWNMSPGQITYGTIGSAPNRKLVVCFNTTGRGSGNADTLNGQIVLEEGTNKIYLNITKKGVSTNSCTQGIEDQVGGIGVPVAGRQNQSWSANNSTMVFTPSGGTLTYTWTPATFLSNTAIANPMATAITSTTTYSVTATNNGCVSSPGTVTVTAGSALTSSGSITPGTTVCEGVTVTFNSVPAGGGSPYTYAWTGPNSFSSTSQNPTRTVTTADAGTYTLVITDACAATSTVTLTLSVNPAPTIAVSPNSGLFCSGSAGVSLTASGSSVSYVWGPAAGLSATTGSNVTASPTVTTTYTVTGTDGNGCSNSTTTAITSAPGVNNVSVVATPTAVCIGSSVNLSATSTGLPGLILAENFNSGAPSWTRVNLSTGGTPADAAWTDRPDGYVYAFGTPYHSNDYTQFVMSNSDDQGSGSTTRTQLISPAFSTVGFNTIMVDFYHYYRDINDNGDSAVVEASLDGINWTIITQYTATTGSEAAFAHPTVALPATYDNQATVYVRFRFIATWDWYWSIDNVTITGNTNASMTYAWTASPAGFTSSIQNPTDNPTVNTTYSVVMTSPAGCTGSATAAVTVNALPTVTAAVSADPSCVNDQITFNGGGAATYVWTGGVTDNVPFTNTAAGSFTYSVTGTDANGCTNTASVSITVNPLPSVTLSGPSTICAGDTAMLTGSSGGTSQWYLNGSPIIGANSNTYAATTAGVYNMTKTNLNGCGDSAAVGITVTVNALPSVTASATPSTVCTGDMVTPAGSGATSYVWSGGLTDGVAFAAMTTMTYTVTGTDANGCEDTASVMVNVNALPVVGATANDTVTCMNDMVTFMGTGATSYTWDNGVTDNVPFMVTASGPFIVTGTDANGCMAMDTLTITVNPLPTVTASASDSLVCAGDSVTFMGGGALTYTWNNGVTDMMPYAVMATDSFIVTGTDANGCMNTAWVVITANPAPVVTVSLPLDTACLLLGPVTLSGETPVGGTWSGPGVTGNTFNPGIAGNGMHAIMYTYIDSLTGCSATAIDSMLVDICNDIDQNEIGTAVMFPNPNNGDFTIVPAGTGVVDVMIYNATGQLVVAEQMACGQQNKVSIAASGMYSVVIVTKDGHRTTQRVIVNR